MDNYWKHFFQLNINNETRLYLLNYSHVTHDQLASYQPNMIGVRTEIEDSNYLLEEFNNNSGPVFTLAYFKTIQILIENKNDQNKLDYSCSVSVLLPLNSKQINLIAEYNKLIQNYIYIKMALTSDDDSDWFKSNTQLDQIKFRSRRDTDAKLDVKFIEIEIRHGPISVYAEPQRKENITCLLKLIDSDDRRLKFEKKIHRLVDTTMYYSSESKNSNFYWFASGIVVFLIIIFILIFLCFFR